MPVVGAPIGNQNAAKKNRLITACLRRELTQRPEDALAIVNKAITDAIAGDAAARAWVADRCDGKAPQPLTGGDDDDSPMQAKITVEYIGAPTAPAKA